MPTNNFYIGERDGWVQIADAPKQIRVSGYPHSHPYYLYAGTSAPSLVGTAATGTITIAGGVPVANQTVTIGSEVYTFKAAAAGPFEVTIGADANATGANLASKINASSTLVNASNLAGAVTVTSKIPGSNYNYALSDTATNVTVSGANMTGGVDAIEGVVICHHPFKFTNPMTEKLFARIVSPVPTSKRGNGTLRVDVITVT